MVGGTYVGNVWITIDMVLKGIMLVRGAIWVPCNLDQIRLTDVKPQEASKSIREQADESKANLKEKAIIVCCFMILAAGVVAGLYFYLKWSAEQYEQSLDDLFDEDDLFNDTAT